MQSAELGEIRHEQTLHQGIGGRDSNCAVEAGIPPAQPGLGRYDLLAYSAQLIAQLLALRRHLVAVRQAIEQPGAQPLFQARNPAEHGRMVHVQELGRSGN